VREVHDEAADLRAAMEVSLADAAVRRAAEAAEAAARPLSADLLSKRYGGCKVLSALLSAAPGEVLVLEPLIGPLKDLLHLERQCRGKWYPGPGTDHWFTTLAGELASQQPSSSPDPSKHTSGSSSSRSRGLNSSSSNQLLGVSCSTSSVLVANCCCLHRAAAVSEHVQAGNHIELQATADMTSCACAVCCGTNCLRCWPSKDVSSLSAYGTCLLAVPCLGQVFASSTTEASMCLPMQAT
jgi:hypothetical protein